MNDFLDGSIATALDDEKAIQGNKLQHLHDIGNAIAKKYGYKHKTGVDVVRFFLMERHHWTPSLVRSMSVDELVFAIEDVELK